MIVNPEAHWKRRAEKAEEVLLSVYAASTSSEINKQSKEIQDAWVFGKKLMGER